MASRVVLSSFKGRRHRHRDCVAEALRAADEVCAARGLRLTALRRRVLELIWAQHRPVGAYELLDRLGDGRKAAPPTIYRALDFLIAGGLVHRIESLNAYIGCGAPRTAHRGQFLICRDCHSVGELNDPAIASLVARRAQGLGFGVERQTIEVVGLCPDCARDLP